MSTPLETAREARLRVLNTRVSSYGGQRQAATWVSLVAACAALIVFFTSIGGEQRPLVLGFLASLSVLTWAVSLLLGLVMYRAQREILDLWWQEREGR